MRIGIIYLCLLLVSVNTKAQIGSGSSSNPEISLFISTDMNIILDRNSVIDKYGNRTPYNNNIKGSPFLNDEWLNGTIYGLDLKKMAQVKLRLNTNGNEIHFLDMKNIELVVDKSKIKKVAMFDELSLDSIYFENGFTDTKNELISSNLVQVLNKGEVLLLKKYTNNVVKKDSLFGAINVYYFAPMFDYYLKNEKNIIQKLKKIDIKTLSTILPNKEIITNYLTQKNKIKTEKEIIEFLDFYNLNNKKISN
ncbi:MAG: hypothetical protein EXR19_03095 [Chitinophagaceae bacterium]|nr:hypothetical protein [Chitinophagaceae bacterium]